MYHHGLIAYPRMDNNFKQKSAFSLFPHPPFDCPGISELGPIVKNKKLPINKEHSLLFLSIVDYIRPSDAVTISKEINVYLDDDLHYKSIELEEEHAVYRNEFKEFIKEKKETRKSLLAYSQSFYRDNQDSFAENTHVCNIRSIYFDNEGQDTKQNRKQYLALKFDKDNRYDNDDEKRRKKLEYMNTDNSFDASSVSEAVRQFEILFTTRMMESQLMEDTIRFKEVARKSLEEIEKLKAI